MTDPATTTRTPQDSRPSSSGKWTIVAIFALGVAVLVGLFLVPQGKPPAPPDDLISGWPDGPVRVVVLDCSRVEPVPRAIAAAVRSVDASPDVVVLVGVDGPTVAPTAEALGMAGSYHPAFIQRVKRRADVGAPSAVCVLSRSRLFGGYAAQLRHGPVVGVLARIEARGHAVSIAVLDVEEPTSAVRDAVDGTSPLQPLTAGAKLVVGRSADGLFAVGPADATFVNVTTRRSSPDAIAFTVGEPSWPPASAPARR